MNTMRISTIDEYNAYFNNLTASASGSGSQKSATVTVIRLSGAPQDTNGNGIPDTWESQYFGGPTNAVAGQDVDGDHFTNLEEYWLGTNPTNAASTFTVQSATVTHQDYNSFNWLSVGGKSYDVQYADDLSVSNAFTTITTLTEIGAPNGTLTNRTFIDDYTLTPSPGQGARIYRVKLHQ